jgi:hypothetical protein
VQPDGPPYVRYHSFDEIETDIEIGVPTQAPTAPDRQISTGRLPDGHYFLDCHKRQGGHHA